MGNHYVLVCGGRDYDDRQAVYDCVEWLKGFYGPELRILHGAARGADALAGQAAEDLGIPCKAFPADWETHKKAGGHIRNAQMRDYLLMCQSKGHSIQVVAFPGGNGTRNMQEIAERAGIAVDQVG